MSRKGNIIIIVLLVAILLVVTNPTEQQFIDWALKKADNNAESKIEELLGNVIGRPVLQLSTTRKDFLLFSIFTVDKGDNHGIFLGLLKYIFIELR